MISTYSELQTAIGNWLHRADVAAFAPDFIALCEAKVSRILRINEVETRATATLDDQYESLPTDYLEMRKLQITTSPGNELTYITPSEMDLRYQSTNSGRPTHYTIESGQLKFETIPTTFTMEMVYYIKVPALSVSAPTNWLLTNHPDVYLYGSLAEAVSYLKNDARIALWKGLYENAINQVIGADQRKRWPSGLVMIPDVPVV